MRKRLVLCCDGTWNKADHGMIRKCSIVKRVSIDQYAPAMHMYEETALSDIAFQWMLGEAKAAGLALDAEVHSSRPLSPIPRASSMTRRGDCTT